MRHLLLAGSRIRMFTCTFMHDGHVFRFASFTPDSLIADEGYLQSLLEAVVL